jgi:hypothetical protein
VQRIPRILGVLVVIGAGLVVQPPPAQAQQDTRRATLSGFVVDRETGERLPGANVYVPSRQTGTVTNDYGFFSLTLPAADSVQLRISYLGYRTRTLTLPLQKDRTIDIELTPVSVELGELEVVGERSLNEVESTQMSSVTLPVAELEKMPALFGEVDVLKAIQLLPGVQSGTEGSTSLYVRGGGPSQNLILLDGVPIYNPSHVFGFLSVFNPDAVKNVRLIKGGFPARYGGRLSSVVDISLEDGNQKEYKADGTLGLVFSSLTAQGPIIDEKASFIVSARRTYIDVLARPFLNRRLDEGERLQSYFYDVNAKLSYAPSPRDRFFLSVYTGRDVYRSTFETVDRSQTPTFRQRNTGGADWGNRTAALRWNHLFSNTLFANVTLLHTGYDFNKRPIRQPRSPKRSGTRPASMTSAPALTSTSGRPRPITFASGPT